MAQGFQAPIAIQGLFNSNNFGLFGLNRNANQRSPLNLLGGNQGGLNQTGLNSLPKPPLLRGLESLPRPGQEDKKDKLDLSSFAEKAAEKAVENARNKPPVGTTNQIIVSEDGRFEASVDLKVNSDGSFALDLAVRFAESSSVGFQSQQALPVEEQPALTEAERQNLTEEELAELEEAEEQAAADQRDARDFEVEGQPGQLSLGGFDALAARQTSFEQILATRDFQAEIFFEESKSVAVSARQAQGDAAAEQYLGVAKQVSQEFTLNVSISGKDLDNFNAVAEQLAQFDDTGTLGGFLQAAQGVLSADSSNIGSFVNATQSLIGATQQHVGAKLNDFFSGLSETFTDLEEIGFEPAFFENLGENVNSDLNRFFELTNNFLGNLFPQSLESSDPVTQQAELLEKNLELLREEQKAKLEEEEKTELSAPRVDEPDDLLTPDDQPQEFDLIA